MVVPASVGAAKEGAPSGMSGSLPSTTDMIVADISIRTVPATVGVIIRRRSESREINANWKIAETAMRLDSIAGPPSASVVMQTAMKAEAEATMSGYPDPNRQIRRVCRIMPRPHTTRLAKNSHAK